MKKWRRYWYLIISSTTLHITHTMTRTKHTVFCWSSCLTLSKLRYSFNTVFILLFYFHFEKDHGRGIKVKILFWEFAENVERTVRQKSLLNCVGCMITWVTWMRELRRSVGAWAAWVIIFTWVASVKYIFAWVNIFCVSWNFLRGSKVFCGSIFFVLGLKKSRLVLSQ